MADSPPSTSTSTVFPIHQPGCTGPTCNPGHTHEADWDACTPECQAALDSSPTAIPTHFCPRAMRKHKIFGKKTSTAPKGNDPFDYEQKYTEDEKYQELGPMTRVWKVFLDECAKYDVEMAEDWRDALDVLLVFAGLFSAVVTTFVSQTSQKLQRDFTEVTAHKMDEMTKLLRVVIAGNNITDVPPSSLSVATKFVPARSDLWVNGLWFTSLALSLTTALLAVLTKQWIHQYMSVPSGTPRDRSRIRQFRFNSLEKWRVPVIIGLLPVLMHVSLGVFFAGLIVYLRNLDTPMSGVVTFVAVVGFVAYTGTNLLPLFKPDCPYKTPLTLHSHGATVFLYSAFKRLIQRWKQTRATGSRQVDVNADTRMTLSLREVEKERVMQVAVDIEAQCLSWLFNISSNSSVQRIVAQALSDLPLKSVKQITQKVPDVYDFIRSTLFLPEHQTEDNNPTYERLFRALVKFVPDEAPPPVTQLLPAKNSLALLVTRDRANDAVALLREQITHPTVHLDVLSWALVLQNALLAGTGWLDVHCTDSDVWKCLLAQLVFPHRCLDRNNCKQEANTLCRLSMPFTNRHRKKLWLEILDLPGMDEPVEFILAVRGYMLPSFYELLWTIAFPSSPFATFAGLPPDICLQLDLMRCSYIQEGFGISIERENETTMMDLINIVQCHLDIQQELGDTIGLHPAVIPATFPTLCNVVESSAFTSDAMTFDMKRDIIHSLFRTVQNPGLNQAFIEWLKPAIITRICAVAFVDSQEDFPSPLITEILEYERGPGSSCGTFIAHAYTYLGRRSWLQRIENTLLGSSNVSPTYTRAYPFLASEYIESITTLQLVDPRVYEETCGYIREPRNTLILSKLLLMIDISRRQSFFKLVAFVGRTPWVSCCRELQSILRSKEGTQLYRYHVRNLHGKHPFRTHLLLFHSPYEDLEVILSESLMIDSSNTVFNGSTTIGRFIKCFTNRRNRTGNLTIGSENDELSNTDAV